MNFIREAKKKLAKTKERYTVQIGKQREINFHYDNFKMLVKPQNSRISTVYHAAKQRVTATSVKYYYMHIYENK